MSDCPHRYVKWRVEVYAEVSDDDWEEVSRKVTHGLTQITATLAGHQPAITATGPVTVIEKLGEE